MQKYVFVLIVILLAGQNSGYVTADSISSRFSVIRQKYHQSMANAQRSKSPREELRRIGIQRKEEFRVLIASGLGKQEELTSADWAALAMASEYLFKRDECIKYSYRAIELDPTTKEAYEPLIRSLLNANRIEEAESILSSAEKQVIQEAKWHGMHYIFYVKYRRKMDWDKAAFHCQTALDTVLFEGGENSKEVREAARQIHAYLDVMQRADMTEQGQRQISEWSRGCQVKLGRLSNDDCSGAHDLRLCASLCELNCEIAKCDPSLDFDVCLALWAKVVFHSRWACCENEYPVQQVNLGNYMMANVSHVKSWDRILFELSSLRDDRFAAKSDDRSDESRAIFLKLREFAKSQIDSGDSTVGRGAPVD